MYPRRAWAALLPLLAAVPCASGTLQLPRALAEDADGKASPAIALQSPVAFEAGVSTLVELIDGPRAGSRLRCTVLSRGELPETYHIRILSIAGNGQEVRNVPSELLQRQEEVNAFKIKLPTPKPFRVPEEKPMNEADRKGEESEGQPEDEQQGAEEAQGAQMQLRKEAQETRPKEEPEEPSSDAKPEASEDQPKGQLDLGFSKEEEEAQRERIRRLLGRAPPPAKQQPSPEELQKQQEQLRRQREEEAKQRREARKKQLEELALDRKRQSEEESKRKVLLKAQRKAYWEHSKEVLHISVQDEKGTELQMSVPRSLALRAVMVTAVDRFGLIGAEVRLMRNGTRLDPSLSIAAAGLHEHDVIYLESSLHVEPKVPPAAAAQAAPAPAGVRGAHAASPPEAARAEVVRAPVRAQEWQARRTERHENRDSREIRHKKPAPWAEPRAAKTAAAANAPLVDYEVGDFLEIKIEHTVRRLDEEKLGGNWIPCTITGKGVKPNTYNVHFPIAPKGEPDITDVPSAVLRMVEAQNWAQKIKRMRQEPEAAQEAVAQAGREAEKRKRLKDLTTRLKGSVATPQKPEQAEKKPPAPGASKRPLAPTAHQGILPQPSLGEKHTSLTRRH